MDCTDKSIFHLLKLRLKEKFHSAFLVTLKYMALEIIQERTDYNEKIDVYSFGVVVHLIFTKGTYP